MQWKIFLQSEVRSWQLTGGGGGVCGERNHYPHIRNVQTTGKIASWGSLCPQVPEVSCNERGKMYAKAETMFNLLWKWLIFQLLLDQRWLTNFLLFSLIKRKEFLSLLQVYSVNLLMSYIPLVIGKVSYNSHRTWPPQHFHKERLEIVAKAVTRVKDGSFEMIFVSAAKGKQKGFVKKFHECGVPKHQMIIWSPSNNGEELKRWLCEADLAIVPSG